MGTILAIQGTFLEPFPSSYVGHRFPRSSPGPGGAPRGVPLVKRLQNCTFPMGPMELAWYRQEIKFKRRRGRSFHRSMSGLRLGGDQFLVTLTHSTEAWDAGLDITAAFRAYIMRLRRRGWLLGYMKVREYTKRGRPHIHILMRVKPGVSRALLQLASQEWWRVLFLSPYGNDVRPVWSKAGAAGYLAKYMGKDSRARYSCSWDWVWYGFTRDWKRLCVSGAKYGVSLALVLELWAALLDKFRDSRIDLAVVQGECVQW